MSSGNLEIKSSGIVYPKKGTNTRRPYDHQLEAMKALDALESRDSPYSSLVVLPTGGGKTYTASTWLLKNALDRKKKVLWLAHRQMLLDQAAESFQSYSYKDIIPHISSYRFKIVSGSSNHCRAIEIKAEDQLLIVSKDSIGRNLSKLDNWLKGEEEVFLVVDEAHHSTARTYRKVIDYVKQRVPKVNLIGLTATPFRTAEDEQGLLSKVFTDDIAYQIGLKDLINKQILSKPVFEAYHTDETYGEELGLDAWDSIEHLDVLPEDIASQMAKSSLRNKLIVETYVKKKDVYGQTLVFAINIVHAIQLSALFNKAGIKADFIISNIKDSVTGATISREENERKLEAYKRGELQVLINVNILTEGVDLPQTRTVFLARPTVSTILMTQMVGRALRGEAAGGTQTAYIVSFIDEWAEHIAWVNPESLFNGNNEFDDTVNDQIQRDLRVINIAKVEEFASVLNEAVDTLALESVDFEKRIPVGMYTFNYLEENGMDLSYQVMVYDSTQQAYEELMQSLPKLFQEYQADEEYLPVELLNQMERKCRDTFFYGDMIPSYEKRDLINILKYYAQYESAPPFYTFEEIDRNKLDIKKIAQYIWDEDMGERKRKEYVDQIWDDNDDNLLRLFFGKKLYFLKQLDIERTKIAYPEIYEDEQNVQYSHLQNLDTLPLYEIGKIDPDKEKELRDQAFQKALGPDGLYHCQVCGKKDSSRIPFQVDHIVPLNKGGKSVQENLQVLCRKCNGKKSDT